jgi:hypothetical protein
MVFGNHAEWARNNVDTNTGRDFEGTEREVLRLQARV